MVEDRWCSWREAIKQFYETHSSGDLLSISNTFEYFYKSLSDLLAQKCRSICKNDLTRWFELRLKITSICNNMRNDGQEKYMLGKCLHCWNTISFFLHTILCGKKLWNTTSIQYYFLTIFFVKIFVRHPCQAQQGRTVKLSKVCWALLPTNMLRKNFDTQFVFAICP